MALHGVVVRKKTVRRTDVVIGKWESDPSL
jgi:hypothetical protein